MSYLLTDPGFYEIEADDYHGDPAPEPSLSQSIGKVLLEHCPRSAWWAHPRLNPQFTHDESTVFDRGTVAHQLLLGKGRAFRIIDASDFRSKAAQMERDAYRQAGFTPILVGHHATASAMVEAARRQLKDIEGGEFAFNDEFGTAELCALSHDPTGCWGRSLIDWYGSRVPSGLVCWDYKTTARSANPATIKSHFNAMGWAFQAAFQERLITTLKPALAGKIAFRFLVQEDAEPYLCSVVEPAADARTIAHKMVAAAFAMWKHCLHVNQWPGYSRTSVPIGTTYGLETQWLEREMVDELVQLANTDTMLPALLAETPYVPRIVAARPAPLAIAAPNGVRKDGTPRKARKKYGPRKPKPAPQPESTEALP